jgi:hypothetical protein
MRNELAAAAVAQDIEKRLSHPIPSLAADLSLPADIAAKVKPGGGHTQYGQYPAAAHCGGPRGAALCWVVVVVVLQRAATRHRLP